MAKESLKTTLIVVLLIAMAMGRAAKDEEEVGST